MHPLGNTEPSVLCHAAAYADHSTVQFLLNSGANVDTPVAGVTSSALIAAAGHGKIHVFNLLLAHADEETISKNFAALHMAASFGHASLVELMLNRGFEIEAKDHHDSNTPLHSVCAASEAYPDVVRLLLSRGADLDARNKNGNTACTFNLRLLVCYCAKSPTSTRRGMAERSGSGEAPSRSGRRSQCQEPQRPNTAHDLRI